MICLDVKTLKSSVDTNKTTILMIGESVSLAHVTRPHELARRLDPTKYEIHFASGNFFSYIKKIPTAKYHSLLTLNATKFYDQISKGKSIYDKEIIQSYVQAELQLISKISPDIIVADNRPTLQISAKLTGIPFINLCNAHWSPYSTLKFPIPDIPITRLYGEHLSKIILPKITPIVLRQHIHAFRVAQKSWGLVPVSSLQEMYTGGTRTAYFDIPEISPTKELPDHHCYLGPVLWEPEVNIDISNLDSSKKIIYLSMGSSGDQSLVKDLVNDLINHNYQVICSAELPAQKGLVCSRYVPGIQASQKADLVLCHGGSGTVYQALTAGNPVIGICKNPDQQFVMQGVEEFGAGVSFKSRLMNKNNLIASIEKLTKDKSYRSNALKAAYLLAKTNPHHKFNQLIDALKLSFNRKGD